MSHLTSSRLIKVLFCSGSLEEPLQPEVSPDGADLDRLVNVRPVSSPDGIELDRRQDEEALARWEDEGGSVK